MNLAEQLMEIFDGREDSFGRYVITDKNKSVREDGKIKGKATTFRKPVTVKLFEEHLAGTGLGIVPIKLDSTVKFGVIDFDNYTDEKTKRDLVRTIYDYELPFFPCLSKSGAVHLYIFTKEQVSAELMYSKLRSMAAKLGISASENGTPVEVFPKQTYVDETRDDAGSWINIPYVGGNLDSGRYLVDRDYKPVSLTDFIQRVMATRLSQTQLENLTLKTDEYFEEGPPCLNYIARNVPDSKGDTFMFNVAVYLKLKYGEEFASYLDEINQDLLEQPLSSRAVADKAKSLGKKDYFYQCKVDPLCGFCDKSLCKTKKYGIGSNSVSLPQFAELRKLDTAPPVWYLDVVHEGRTFTLELETKDLQVPRNFQLRCMEKANFMPSLPAQDTWLSTVNNLMQEVITIEVQKFSDDYGEVLTLLRQFCTQNARCLAKDELDQRHAPYHDEEQGRILFTSKAFMDFLKRNNYTGLPKNKIQGLLRNSAELDYKTDFFQIGGRKIYYISIKEYITSDENYKLPQALDSDINKDY